MFNISNLILPPLNYNFTHIDVHNPIVNIYTNKNDTYFHGHSCFKNGTVHYNLTDNEKQLVNNLTKLFPVEIINELVKANYSMKKIKGFVDLVNGLSNIASNYSWDMFDNDTQILLRKSVLYSWYKTSVDDETLKLYSTDIFKDIIIKINDCISEVNELRFLDDMNENNSRCTKFNLVGGHDTNIVDILNNILDESYIDELIKKALVNSIHYNHLIPQFAASLIFELHKHEHNHYVKLLYNGEEIFEKFKLGIIYEKGKGIALRDFRNLLQSRIGQIEGKICKADDDD